MLSYVKILLLSLAMAQATSIGIPGQPFTPEPANVQCSTSGTSPSAVQCTRAANNMGQSITQGVTSACGDCKVVLSSGGSNFIVTNAQVSDAINSLVASCKYGSANLFSGTGVPVTITTRLQYPSAGMC
ncbi:hypothetical protein DFH28DRAFT_90088 [Melampsora americana]|nr:hypothetical protein DFH28DRAFT_90088 [Melampsora americana]